MRTLNNLSGPILRYGMALVFLYFGISQIVDTANFLGYLPNFLFNTSFASTLILINGVFEIIASILLIIGYKTRIVATILALHLALITFEVGWSQTGIRDFGLTIATTAIALQGPDIWCLDKKFMRGKK